MSPTLRNKNISRNTKSLVINAFVNSTLYYGMQCHTLTATQLKELNSVVMDAKRVAINMRRNDHIRNEEIDLKVQTYNVSATILGQRTRMANMIEMYAKTSWKILNTEPEGGGNRNQWVKSKWCFSKSTGGAVNDTATKFSCVFYEAEFGLNISSQPLDRGIIHEFKANYKRRMHLYVCKWDIRIECLDNLGSERRVSKTGQWESSSHVIGYEYELEDFCIYNEISENSRRISYFFISEVTQGIA